jgi:hypothetical protein
MYLSEMAKRNTLEFMDVDRSGRVKADTLEFFLINPGCHSVKTLNSDPILCNPYTPEVDSYLQMRLLRYTRDGLLKRQKVSRRYKYIITERGEDRLFYLWKKLGYLNTDENLSQEEKMHVSDRLNMKISVLKARKMKIEQESTSSA